MSLREELIGELVIATKSRDRTRLSTIRLLISDIKNREIDLKRELHDEEVFQVISSMIRQRRESIEQFKLGYRQDLVEREEEELRILASFLPPQLSQDEVVDIVKELIKDTGASGMKDMGMVMKEAISKVAGRAEGKTVSDIVREILSAGGNYEAR
ncbi:MAG: GatB/YqeY domain-containing protein [Thermodesulfobacteriota bacterium]